MRHFIFVLFLVYTNYAFSQNQSQINGKIDNLPNSKVYLFGFPDDGKRIADSSFSTNGTFKLNGEKLDTPYIASIYYKNRQGEIEMLYQFIFENKPITILGGIQ